MRFGKAGKKRVGKVWRDGTRYGIAGQAWCGEVGEASHSPVGCGRVGRGKAGVVWCVLI